MRIAALFFLTSMAVFAAAGGGPAVYVVGNLDSVSPGDQGLLALDQNAVVFRSGKTVLSLPYSDIHNVELGTRIMPPSDAPLLKVWRLPKRFLTERAMHQMVNFTFADKNGNDQTMTLELEEAAANQTLVEIEIRQGKRTAPQHATNGDSWWGDSAWKTTRNNNTVSQESLGTVHQPQSTTISPAEQLRQPTQPQIPSVEPPAASSRTQPQKAVPSEWPAKTEESTAIPVKPSVTKQPTQQQGSVVTESSSPLSRQEPIVEKNTSSVKGAADRATVARVLPSEARSIQPAPRQRSIAEQQLGPRDLAYGSLIHGQIIAKNPAIPDSEAAPILRSVFHNLSATTSAQSGSAVPSLTYLHSAEINAFATAGGRLYVTDSLVQAVDGNPGILAFVMGHEMAHNVYQHGLQKYMRAIEERREIAIFKQRIAQGDQTANWALITYLAAEKIASAKLDRDQENAADRLGMMMAAEAGYHPTFAILAARTLREKTGDQSKFGAFFSDHPRWTTREQRAEQGYAEALNRFNGAWDSTEASPGGRPPVLVSVAGTQVSKTPGGREITANFSVRNVTGTPGVLKLMAVGSGGSRTAASRILTSDEQGSVVATLNDQDLKALGEKASVSVIVEFEGVTSYIGAPKQIK